MNQSDNQKITIGMGCFWSPDALFGQLPGITRTRVGFAGGTTSEPTYHELGDHTETVEVNFDASIISLETILNVFWTSHKPDNINDYRGRRYRSLVLYRDPLQESVIRQVMRSIGEQAEGLPDTEVSPYTGFYTAEDRHQKYYLKRFPDAIAKVRTLFPTDEELTNATLAARLNGLAKGYTNMERIRHEIRTWQLSSEEQDRILHLIKQIKW